jgi:hypothetical protein
MFLRSLSPIVAKARDSTPPRSSKLALPRCCRLYVRYESRGHGKCASSIGNSARQEGARGRRTPKGVKADSLSLVLRELDFPKKTKYELNGITSNQEFQGVP